MQKPKLIPGSRFHVKKRSLARLVCVASFVVLVTSLAERLRAQTTNTAASALDIVITGIEGKVEVLRVGAQTWDPAYTNQVLHAKDQVRVPERGRVTLLLSDQSVERFGELSEFTIEPPSAAGKQPGFSLVR